MPFEVCSNIFCTEQEHTLSMQFWVWAPILVLSGNLVQSLLSHLSTLQVLSHCVFTISIQSNLYKDHLYIKTTCL